MIDRPVREAQPRQLLARHHPVLAARPRPDRPVIGSSALVARYLMPNIAPDPHARIAARPASRITAQTSQHCAGTATPGARRPRGTPRRPAGTGPAPRGAAYGSRPRRAPTARPGRARGRIARRPAGPRRTRPTPGA